MGREEKFKSTGFVHPFACYICYFVVLEIFVFTTLVPPTDDLPTNWLISAFVTTLVVWGFSYIWGNTSMYDPYWCWYPIFFGGCMLYQAKNPKWASKVGYVCLVAWASRYNWDWPWEGWTVGIHTEDWRYIKLAKDIGVEDSVPMRNWQGAKYWIIVSLIQAHLIPTVLVSMVLLPYVYTFYPFISNDHFYIVRYPETTGAWICFLGVLLQHVSDKTLRTFRIHNVKITDKDKSKINIHTNVCPKICTQGPWSYSRHPNYVGECMFWLGMQCMAPATYFSWFLYFLFVCFFRVSASLMDARSLKNRPGYIFVMQSTPALFPLPFGLDAMLDRLLIKDYKTHFD